MLYELALLLLSYNLRVSVSVIKMSWWDTSAISGLATQALKKAQKGIDKVLEIKDEEGWIDRIVTLP
jgi:hypothetical protein